MEQLLDKIHSFIQDVQNVQDSQEPVTKPARKKRPADGRARKNKKRAAEPAPTPANNAIEQSRQNSLQQGSSSNNAIRALGIDLNPTTARQAVILSEIIGKPVSQRNNRR